MTGDGVNDAPALKSYCGIAVSGATDAARAAAAIVLLTPGLSVIIDAIKESRRIFQHAYPRFILDNTPGEDPVDRGARNANDRYPDRCLRVVHDAHWLGLGVIRLALCPGLVSCK